jgi:phosphopantothenoylcysteine decarboxylase/phosphopantothenate--cysteine ligase
VGFAADSETLLAHARIKLERKGLDLLIANDITAPDAGFEVDTNRVVILGADGSQTPLPLASKTRIAEAIVSSVAHLLP